MSQLDLTHLQRVQCILDTLGDADVPHAMLACEDAFVGLSIGLNLGLTVEQIAKNHAEIITEEETARLRREHGLRPGATLS